MIYKHLARTKVSGGVLFLTVILALAIVGVAVAQSVLPGVRLTTDPANDLRPAWSPDGTRIAFFSNRSDSNDIWVMDADGENQRELTNGSADDRRPAWSPDGARIAFDSDRSGSRDIWIMDNDGGNLQQLTDDPGQETFPAWSPDGAQIAYYAFADGATDLWIVNADGQNPRRLTTGLADERLNQCTFACHVPSWSPDGTQIAYPAMNHHQVWVVEADGSNQHRLSIGQEHEHFPWWTPDGRIQFLVERTNNRQEPVNDVWIMDANGQNATMLFSDIPHGGPFEFRPDGATIAFHSPRAGNFDIYTSVLGQEAPAAVEAAPPAQVTSAPAQEPTAPADAAPAPASETTATPGDALGVVAIAAIAVAGVLVAVFLTRRGRSM